MSPRHEHKTVQLRLDDCGNAIAPASAEAHTYDRVVMRDLWGRVPYPRAALHEAARLLRDQGKLQIVEHHPAVPLREAVRLLTNSGWEIHRCTEDGGGFELEVGIRDESVTS